MKRFFCTASLTLACLSLAATGCNTVNDAGAYESKALDQGHGWENVTKAICAVHATSSDPDSQLSGVVTFTQTDDGVRVVADFSGLAPGKHGFHVHEFGDCTALDGKSAGGHYNPDGHPHGLPGSAGDRHAGDLGNLEAGQDGKAHYDATVKNISVAGKLNPIVGRAIIVHADPDDGSQPTGNAGDRVGAGVIGVAKSG